VEDTRLAPHNLVLSLTLHARLQAPTKPPQGCLVTPSPNINIVIIPLTKFNMVLGDLAFFSPALRTFVIPGAQVRHPIFPHYTPGGEIASCCLTSREVSGFVLEMRAAPVPQSCAGSASFPIRELPGVRKEKMLFYQMPKELSTPLMIGHR